jgi:chromatin assembly factor 1 subunit B
MLPKVDGMYNCAHVFSRQAFNRGPLAHVPGFARAVVCIAAHPQAFTLHDPVEALKVQQYRHVVAVASQDNVLIMDTSQTKPLALIGNLHYANITDLAWSPDGRTLLMSSQDGYCSMVVFDEGELGEVYTLPEHVQMDLDPAPQRPVKREAVVTIGADKKRRIVPTLVSLDS